MATPRAYRWLAGCVLAGVALAGCGGSPSETLPDEVAQPTAEQAPSAREKNACDLVDRAALEAIAGRSLVLLHDVEDEEQTTCELRDAAASDMVLVYVTVNWSGGREMAEAQKAALGLARSILNEPDVDIEALTGSGAVEGLADDAYYSNIMPSWILKDDVMVSVLSPTFGFEQTKGVFLSVAKTALERLP